MLTLKRTIVEWCERLCIVEHLLPEWIQARLPRHCLMARVSIWLDDKWHTGLWEDMTEQSTNDGPGSS